ncbi:MAG: AraC family transcriptional regulator [Rhodocyclaceae bacterium]|nr:AraC family transcriptional regulator [Rhodocyclaceae bacterium]
MTDRLAGLLRHYALRAEVFHTGRFCGNALYDGPRGYIHLLRSGRVEVLSPVHSPMTLTGPSVLLYPRAASHRFVAGEADAPDLVCAGIELGGAAGNPLALALPPVTVLPLEQLPPLERLLALLFEEAAEVHCGRQAAIDRLCELVLIHLLRHLMDEGAAEPGLMAGLADPRLARALSAIHDAPGRDWSLDDLAREAGMSRARFAVAFRETVGSTPGAYLAGWRVNVTCSLLRQGRPVGVIADAVGYANAPALARAFRSRLGCSPTEWAARQRAAGTAQARQKGLPAS